MNEELIAACGMNCALCSSYLSKKNELKEQGIGVPYCDGCRPRSKMCAFIKKKCSLVKDGTVQYCFECADFPCDILKKLDAKYNRDFHMSMIENLNAIKKNGIDEFLNSQREQWTCQECGEIICCHNGICFNCGMETLRDRKPMFRWD